MRDYQLQLTALCRLASIGERSRFKVTMKMFLWKHQANLKIRSLSYVTQD